MSITGIPELKESYRQLGLVRFCLFFGGLLAFLLGWAAAHFWLADKIGWPEAYGFQCRGRGCMWVEIWHSPALLKGGDAYELGMFALIWWLPALVVGCLIYALLKRLRRRNPILPMNTSE